MQQAPVFTCYRLRALLLVKWHLRCLDNDEILIDGSQRLHFLHDRKRFRTIHSRPTRFHPAPQTFAKQWIKLVLGWNMRTYQRCQIRYVTFFLTQLNIIKFGKVNTSSVSQVHQVRCDPKGTGSHFESRNSGNNESSCSWFNGRSYRV